MATCSIRPRCQDEFHAILAFKQYAKLLGALGTKQPLCTIGALLCFAGNFIGTTAVPRICFFFKQGKEERLDSSEKDILAMVDDKFKKRGLPPESEDLLAGRVLILQSCWC